MHEDLILLNRQTIKSKRTEKNITLEELANRAGVNMCLRERLNTSWCGDASLLVVYFF